MTDYDYNDIQVFAADGKFLWKLGSYGTGRGQLRRPWGVTMDCQDRVYVSEADNNCVSAFTKEGQFVTSFGSYGVGPGHFRGPLGLAVDSSGVVHVCDQGNKLA